MDPKNDITRLLKNRFEVAEQQQPALKHFDAEQAWKKIRAQHVPPRRAFPNRLYYVAASVLLLFCLGLVFTIRKEELGSKQVGEYIEGSGETGAKENVLKISPLHQGRDAGLIRGVDGKSKYKGPLATGTTITNPRNGHDQRPSAIKRQKTENRPIPTIAEEQEVAITSNNRDSSAFDNVVTESKMSTNRVLPILAKSDRLKSRKKVMIYTEAFVARGPQDSIADEGFAPMKQRKKLRILTRRNSPAHSPKTLSTPVLIMALHKSTEMKKQ